MSIVYYKDSFLPEQEVRVSVHDRAFRFGDGIFETLLVVNGKLMDFAVHLARLKSGLAYFDMKLETSHLEVLSTEVIKRNNIQNGYIRIVVSRGENTQGAIGYLPLGATPYVLIQAIEKPYPDFKTLSLYVASERAFYRVPCKTNNAMLYTRALMEAGKHGCDNALLLDAKGRICETATGNIFWIRGGTLYTPATTLPFVPGTVRKKVLRLWQGAIEEGEYTLDALQHADEIFMTNIGMIVAAIGKIELLGYVAKGDAHTKTLRAAVDAEFLNMR